MAAPNPSSIGDYGMPVVDYVATVTDPTTDQPASGADQQACDTAMMSRPATRAWVSFTTNGTNAPVLVAHEAQWGVGTAPVLARTGTGVYTVTWPAMVTDQLGNTQSVNLRFALGAGATVFLSTGYVINYAASANVATVSVFSVPSGAVAADTTGVPISVVVR